MANSNRITTILVPAFLYGGMLSATTDLSLLFFFNTDIQTIHSGWYFWGHTSLMIFWCSLWYPKLLWAWTCDEFIYPYSTMKLSYTLAFLFSFVIQMLNTIITGLFIQKYMEDPYFSLRILYTPTATFCGLYCLECAGINHVIRTILLHDL